MNGVLTVYRKEMALYFRSPIAYFVVAVFLLATGYFFSYDMIFTGIASLDTTFQSMGMMVLIVLPVVSMRLFAGEYAAGTMELTMTLPIRPWQIVLGKYLGAISIFLLITVASLIDLIPLYLFSEPKTTTILSGYIGFVLLGMACLAIGQLFSALTENQVVAALITIPVLLAFWFVGNLQSFQTDMTIWSLVGYLSFSMHYAQFIQGMVRTEAIGFYVLVCAIALTLNAGYLQWRR